MLRSTAIRAFSSAAKCVPNGSRRLEYFPGKQAIDKNRSYLSQRVLPSMSSGLRDPWIKTQLIIFGRLLMEKRSDEAYKHVITTLPITQAGNKREYYSRAIRMFIQVGDYERVIKFINYLTESGYDISLTSYVQLLAGKQRHDTRHLEQVLDIIASRTSLDSITDDNIFLSILSAVVLCKSPDESFRLFETRCRDKRYWLPSAKFEALGLVIAAYSKALDMENAKRLLLLHAPPPSGSTEVASRPLKMLISLLHQKDFSYPQDRSDDEVRQHLESRNWPTSSFELGGSIRERNPECYPYTALLQGYQRSKEPRLEDVFWLLEYMKTQSIALDAEFCNTLIKTLVHWCMEDVSLGIYYAMMENADFPLPSLSTFRKALVAWRNKRGRSDSQSILARKIFRDMMLCEDVKPSHLDLTHWHYLDLRSLKAAITAFIRGRDFGAAIVAKDVFLRRYGLNRLNQLIKDQCIKDMAMRIRSEEQLEGNTWADRLMGGRTEALFTDCTTRLFNAAQDRSWTFPHSHRMVKNKGSFVTQLLLRGLHADLGFTVPDWDRPINPMDVYGEIRGAEMDMIPFMKKINLQNLMSSCHDE